MSTVSILPIMAHTDQAKRENIMAALFGKPSPDYPVMLERFRALVAPPRQGLGGAFNFYKLT